MSFGGMKTVRSFMVALALLAAAYLMTAGIVFDFTSSAVPFDEESYRGRTVAIGPKPRAWVPRSASGVDVVGGFRYEPTNWPFVLWKPICIGYLRVMGLELPVAWR